MCDVNFFSKSNEERENLLAYHYNKLTELSKVLAEILYDGDCFMNYLAITNFPGVVESFTSNNIIVDYEEIIKYIRENVNSKDSFREFLLQLIKQSDLISGNDVVNDYQFRKEFSFLFK